MTPSPLTLRSPSRSFSRRATPPTLPRLEPPLAALLASTRRGPLGLEAACQRLSLDRAALCQLVDGARADGLELAIVHDQVVRAPRPPSDQVRELAPAPSPAARFVVGVLSDTHLGSRYCRRRELRAFVRLAYRKGARHILHAGDVLDGMYKHGLFELTHSGLEAQTQDLFETLPQLEGLTYHAIGGNRRGNGQWAMGNRRTAFCSRSLVPTAVLPVSPIAHCPLPIARSRHPRGSCGASVEPRVRQKILSYAPGQVPNVLLVGHWHRFVHTSVRGVEGIACPTFQGSGSAFGKSLVGEPAIGGLVLSWTAPKQGRLRSFRIERCSYPERETLHDLGGFVRSPSPRARSRPPQPPDTRPAQTHASKAVTR